MALPSRETAAREVRRIVIIVLACILYAFSFNCFYEANQIAYGGITGFAQAIHAVLGLLPVGVLVIIFNVPLFILAWKYLGGGFLLLSLFTMAVSSVFIDLIALFHTFPPMDPLLASIYGGVLLGFSSGLLMRQNATTGGTTILARLIKRKTPWVSMGTLQLFADLAAIAVVAVVVRNVNSALYGIVALYISSLVIDTVLYGASRARLAYIISMEHTTDIARAITQDLSRGVTLIPGTGGYTGQPHTVLMCAIKRNQIVALKSLVKEIDADAFIIVCEAKEVFGRGFDRYKSDSW